MVAMSGETFGAEMVVESAEERARLQRIEIRAQDILCMEICGDDVSQWQQKWINSGLAELFRTLIEKEPVDEELIALVHTQPKPGSPEAASWAQEVYEHVRREQSERAKNG
jgi:hypothetical protein